MKTNFDVIKAFIKNNNTYKKAFFYKDGECIIFVRFEKDTNKVARTIKERPSYMVFKDNSFLNEYSIEKGKIYDTKIFVDYKQLQEIKNVENTNKIKDILDLNYIEVADISKKELEVIKPFIGQDEIRYYLNGIYLDIKNKNIVATNGHLLYCNKIEIKNPKIEYDGIIFNCPFIVDDIRLFCYCEKGWYYAKYEYKDFIIFDSLIEGNFPNYTKSIPNSDKMEDISNIEKYLDSKKFDNVILGKNESILENTKNNISININERFFEKDNYIEKIIFNVKYLKTIFEATNSREMFYTYNTSPVLFKENDKVIILMPIMNY